MPITTVTNLDPNVGLIRDGTNANHNYIAHTGIPKGTIFNTAKAQNTDFFGTAISPTLTPAMFKVQITTSSASTLLLRRTSGGDTISEQLHSGSTLSPNVLTKLDFIVDAGETINFRTNTIGGTTVLKMTVVEDINYI